VVKTLPVNAVDTRDTDLIPGSERSPGRGNAWRITGKRRKEEPGRLQSMGPQRVGHD